MPASRVSIAPILLVNFVGTLGFSIVLPFLVFLVMRWGGNALIYGIMGATYSAFQLVGAPILGRWSDRFGRRRILLLSQLGTLLSWVVFAVAFLFPAEPILQIDSGVLGVFALTWPLLIMFLARAADGLTGGNISVANAYLADISTDENRNANFGKMGVSANLGFIVGPALAGLLGSTAGGELVPVLTALSISLVATLLIAFRLPESRPCALVSDPDPSTVHKTFGQEHRPCYELKGAAAHTWRDVLRQERVPRLLAINFLVMLGFNFYYISFPVYAVRTLSWTVSDTGVFFSVLSLLMAAVQGPLLGYASRRWSESGLAIVGSAILAASFLAFTRTDTVTVYAGAAALALGNGLMWPSVVAMVAQAAGPAYQGTVQGLASSGGAVASILGLVVGGVLFEQLGPRVFVLSAVTILAVFALTLPLRSTLRYHAPHE